MLVPQDSFPVNVYKKKVPIGMQKNPRMSALSFCVEYSIKEKALTKHSYTYNLFPL